MQGTFGFGHIHTIRKNPKIAPICQIRVSTRGTCTCKEPQPIPIDSFSNPNNQQGYVDRPNRSVGCQRECKRIRLEFRLCDCGGGGQGNRILSFDDVLKCGWRFVRAACGEEWYVLDEALTCSAPIMTRLYCERKEGSA